MSANNTKEMGFVTADGSEVDQDVYYLGLQVPEGRRAYVVFREVKMTENQYTVQVVTAANGFTGGTEGYGSQLHEGGVRVVQSKVFGDVTPDGAETIAFEDIVDAGTSPGASRIPLAGASDVFAHSWVSSPMIKITRAAGGQPYRVPLRVIVYEEEHHG